jgi:hypothetical protein
MGSRSEMGQREVVLDDYDTRRREITLSEDNGKRTLPKRREKTAE